jgi:von Willebrand factor type A domain
VGFFGEDNFTRGPVMKGKRYFCPFLCGLLVFSTLLISELSHAGNIFYYGNYGMKDYTGGQKPTGYYPTDFSKPSVDSMDELFKKHDQAYWAGGKMGGKNGIRFKKEADIELLKGLEQLSIVGVKNWDRKPTDPYYARSYLIFAIRLFRAIVATGMIPETYKQLATYDLKRLSIMIAKDIKGEEPYQEKITQPLTGEQGKSILFILDTSGSMDNLTNDKKYKKIDAAKIALKSVLEKSKGSQKVEWGVLTFAECRATPISVPFTSDTSTVYKALDQMKAHGGTPLAKAILKADEYSRKNARYEKVEIVLLTDGMETCGGNPVRASKQILMKMDSSYGQKGPIDRCLVGGFPQKGSRIIFNEIAYSYLPEKGFFQSALGEYVSAKKNALLKSIYSYFGDEKKVRGLPPVIFGAKKYNAYYSYLGNIRDTRGEIFTLYSGDEWERNNLKKIIVLDEQERLVKNEDALRNVFLAYNRGYRLYSFSHISDPDEILKTIDVENPPESMLGVVKNLNEHLLAKLIFVEQGFKQYFTDLIKGGGNSKRAIYEGVLREMLISEKETKIPVEVKRDVFQKIKDGKNTHQVLSELARAGQYSGNYRIQRYSRKLEKLIKNVTTVRRGGGKYGRILRISGKEVNILWTSHLVDLFTALAEERVYFEERTALIKRLSRVLHKYPEHRELHAAVDNVILESEMNSEEELFENFYNFLIEKSVSLGFDYGKKVLIKSLEDYIWQAHRVGARTVSQHLLASAAGQISVGLMVSNILWGMDSIYANAINARASMEIKNKLKGLFKYAYSKENVREYYPVDYCEELISVIAFIKLCNASFYRNMAGIAGSSQFKTFLVDFCARLMGGISMSDAIDLNRGFSSDIEFYAERDFISPSIVDYTVQLAISMPNGMASSSVSGSIK